MKESKDLHILVKWLYDHDMTQEALAFEIGMSTRQLQRIILGYSMPSERAAYKIERLTQGEIPMVVWGKKHAKAR